MEQTPARGTNNVAIFNTKIAPLSYDEVIHAIHLSIQSNTSLYIDASNTMVIGRAAINSTFHSALKTFDDVVPDSMPLVWYIRSLGLKAPDPCYGPELTARIIKRYGRHYKILVVGSTEQTKRAFNDRFPKTPTWITGYIDHNEKSSMQKVISTIRNIRPDIIFIALGCPKQHYVMQAIKPLCKSEIVIGVGSAFDILSGRYPMIPTPIRRIGFGWLYRAMHDPVRLWPRYLFYNMLFIILALYYYLPNRLGVRKRQNSDI
jgi:N-acetylglucosaminyldiphosphoundecaprenol N-acetyl-beta-D-mannosaminyltransferase